MSLSGDEAPEGRNGVRPNERPSTKWEVYESTLRVPYYVVYDRYKDVLHAHRLTTDGFQLLVLPDKRLWLPEIELGLGVLEGSYRDVDRKWLRFYTKDGAWIPTEAGAERARADAERERAEAERQRAGDLAARLRALGVDPDEG